MVLVRNPRCASPTRNYNFLIQHQAYSRPQSHLMENVCDVVKMERTYLSKIAKMLIHSFPCSVGCMIPDSDFERSFQTLAQRSDPLCTYLRIKCFVSKTRLSEAEDFHLKKIH